MKPEDAEWVFPLIMLGVWTFALLLVAVGLAVSGRPPPPSRQAPLPDCKFCKIYPLPNCNYCGRSSAA